MSDIQCVLFDLDGTVLDTAPDLAFALNETLLEAGRPTLPFELIRPHVSKGSPGLIRLGFGEDTDFEALRARFLYFYEANLCRATTFFSGMEALLADLDARKIPWGIVTNKPGWLTDPLLAELALDARAQCVISGDTLAHAKPHPAPLLRAAELIKVAPESCLYIGDDERDVQAARSAGMQVLVAMYGYLAGSDPNTWEPDGFIHSPGETLAFL
ncbi:MAG: phosphoglycolate phosphatase [Pseudomonadota bacterium]